MPNHMKFVSASGDFTARLWDITESQCNLLRTFNGHSRSVKTVTFKRKDPAVFATGSRDGSILIWDSRATLNVDMIPKADNCIYSGHAGGPGTPQSFRKKTRTTPKIQGNVSSSSITGLAFQDEYTLFSCGAGDGIIKIWDLRRNYSCYKKEPQPKHSLAYPGTSTFKGYTNLLIDNVGQRLYVNCMDSNIYAYNLASTSNDPIMKYSGHKNTTFYIKSCLSPDDKYIISGSSDGKAYIWNVEQSQPIVALTGHTVEVTCAAWSQMSDTRIVTCSEDARHKIWRISPEFMDENELMQYKGVPEENKDYRSSAFSKKLRFKHLEYTPRSIKRLIDQNEKTPTNTVSNKRKLSAITEEEDGNKYDEGHILKRPNTETRGRRLFAPIVASTSTAQPMSTNNLRSLASFLEDVNTDDHLLTLPIKTSLITGRLMSPLTENVNNNLRSPPEVSSSLHNQYHLNNHTESSIYSSPTSNLPNYVLDGEAPHLRITSPKRKLKENVDWLTKIRKQKLLSTASTAKCHAVSAEILRDESEFHDGTMLSPRVQSLKNEEGSPRPYSTPKRRSSRSGSNPDNSILKTPNSTRRGSTESILKFFSIKTPLSVSKEK